ncbi:MAG: hypothetical protein LBR55_05065, partial [Bacteroidales bacterium]|nr:hypothetical protein [Bacteroidales bacterium]
MKKFFVLLQKILVVLVLCAGSVCVLQSCGEKKFKALTVNPEFAKYVISFTSGVVSNQTKISLRFVQDIAGAEAGKELSSNPFSISPKIKGKAVWVDKQTIEFTPDQALTAGEIYTVSCKLDKFIEVPKELKTLTFSFQVLKQAMNYEFEGISPYNETDAQWQRIHGSFATADYANSADLEAAVKAGNYKFSWKHSADGKTHNFTIDSVERKQTAYTIQMEWNGAKIGAKKSSGSKKLSMPALNEFKVLGVRQKNMPKVSIDVFFSDPLNKKQDMSGLFTLNPTMNETILIDGTKAQIIPTKWVSGEVELKVHAGVKNMNEKRLDKDFTHTFNFVSMMPQVELLGDGVIVPGVEGIKFPFRAVSLSAVDVRVIQIFENNIVQFLQQNQLNGTQELQRVGRLVYSAEVPLISDEAIDYNEWNNFALDLSKFIQTEPGAIYRVELSFRKKHSLYPCVGESNEEDEYQDEDDDPYAIYNNASGYYYWSNNNINYSIYKWSERNDPCKPSYYMDKTVARNVL